ncbi:MAG: hypothetical protein GXO27_00685 [Chlorobi bacterium]|nr:hypothetical protein [Chlorobiota bacterium]
MAKITTFPLTARMRANRLWSWGIIVFSSIYLIRLFRMKAGSIAWAEAAEKFLQWEILAVSALLAGINWLLRIYKWHVLVPGPRRSFRQSAFEQLTAFSWSFYTPFNAGEFVHKPALHTRPKQALARVGVEQLAQMHATLMAGAIGAALMWASYAPLLYGVAAALFIGGAAYNKIYRRAYILSLLRYGTFALLTAYILGGPGGTDHAELVRRIPLYYLAVSFLPLLPWLDLPVKTGVALWIFGTSATDPAMIAAAMVWLWLWNTFIPASAGLIWWAAAMHTRTGL